jgi:hypothetical protein
VASYFSGRLAWAVQPAESTQDPTTLVPAVSSEYVIELQAPLPKPEIEERGSITMLTGALYQPFEFGWAVATAFTVGGSASTLRSKLSVFESPFDQFAVHERLVPVVSR